MGIQYSGKIDQEKLMIAASDASFADDITRRSTQGFLIKLFGGPIVWQSTLQRTIVLSTAVAEIMALTSLGREIMSLRRLFESIRFDPDCDSILLCDNQQTVGCNTKDHPQLTTKMRHIDIHHLWLRQESKKGIMAVLWVPTNEQPADGFTKILGYQKHSDFVQKLGLCELEYHEARGGE